MNLAEKILLYNSNLEYLGKLPEGISMMNPFKENDEIKVICESFYKKFYSDNKKRFIMLGINPGRLGAGATGIPFTDTKRLTENCGLSGPAFTTYEPSSVFMYEMMEHCGGVKNFYDNIYVNSVFPLGFIKNLPMKKAVNYNYYDDKKLMEILVPYIKKHIKKQIEICGESSVVFCLGRGKNFQFLKKLNDEYTYFKKVIPLEHPRFIMQYKSKFKTTYFEQYKKALFENGVFP
jgi:hypothetical protein